MVAQNARGGTEARVDEIEALKARIADLEAENKELREELEAIRPGYEIAYGIRDDGLRLEITNVGTITVAGGTGGGGTGPQQNR